MKKHFKTIAIALLATVSTLSTFAADRNPDKEKGFDVGMYFDYNSGKIKTFVEKEAGQSLEISFQDEKGTELQRTHMSKKEVKGKVYFDVNDLPSGTYQVKVTFGDKETTQTIHISRSEPVQVVEFM